MIDLEIMKHWQKWLFEDELRLNYLSKIQKIARGFR